MSDTSAPAAVGVIGLGIMGMAYCKNLRAAGFKVAGFDPDAGASAALRSIGGTPCDTAADVARQTGIILFALPSVSALEAVVSGPDGITTTLTPGTVICEMGTFAIEAKTRAADAIAAAGGILLDCPVSGTGAQAAVGDLVVYTSGDEVALAHAKPALAALSREQRHVGPFGAGMKMKYVANLLVTIHNLATAEALLLAERSGLDLQLTFDAIASGAATSRMFEIRGPMMVADTYEPATMKHDVYVKDLQLIMDHARESSSPTPLMAACLPFYHAALAAGRGKQDTASVFAVLRDMTKPGKPAA